MKSLIERVIAQETDLVQVRIMIANLTHKTRKEILEEVEYIMSTTELDESQIRKLNILKEELLEFTPGRLKETLLDKL